jgi:hypothetical protein
MMLVSLQQARDHLRSDSSADDNDLTLKIYAASAIIMEHINTNIDDFTDTAGDLLLDTSGEADNVPYAIQAACLILVGILYAERQGESGVSNPQWRAGYLPAVVTSLLAPYHDPVFA